MSSNNSTSQTGATMTFDKSSLSESFEDEEVGVADIEAGLTKRKYNVKTLLKDGSMVSVSSSDRDSNSDTCRELTSGDPGMRMLRILVYMTLLGAAALVSSMAWFYIRMAEKREFELRYADHSTHIHHAVLAETASKLSCIDALAITVHSHAMNQAAASANKTDANPLGFLTLPEFPWVATGALLTARAAGIGLVPPIDANHRYQWESYSVQNDQWRIEGLNFQARFPEALAGAGGHTNHAHTKDGEHVVTEDTMGDHHAGHTAAGAGSHGNHAHTEGGEHTVTGDAIGDHHTEHTMIGTPIDGSDHIAMEDHAGHTMAESTVDDNGHETMGDHAGHNTNEAHIDGSGHGAMGSHSEHEMTEGSVDISGQEAMGNHAGHTMTEAPVAVSGQEAMGNHAGHTMTEAPVDVSGQEAIGHHAGHTMTEAGNDHEAMGDHVGHTMTEAPLDGSGQEAMGNHAGHTMTEAPLDGSSPEAMGDPAGHNMTEAPLDGSDHEAMGDHVGHNMTETPIDENGHQAMKDHAGHTMSEALVDGSSGHEAMGEHAGHTMTEAPLNDNDQEDTMEMNSGNPSSAESGGHHTDHFKRRTAETTHHSSNAHAAEGELMEFSRSIFHVADERPQRQTGDGPFYPLWQHFPNHPGFPWINYDLHQSNGPAIDMAMESGEVVLGHYFDLATSNHGHDLPTVSDQSFRYQDQGHTTFNHPQSHRKLGHHLEYAHEGPALSLWYPILDSFDGNRQVIALLMATVKWDSFFLSNPPPNPNGIIVVVHNPCDQVFTFKMEEGHQLLHYLGPGDHHEEKYDQYRLRTKIEAPGSTFTKVPLNTEYCPWTVDVYPSTQMEEAFYTNKPAIFAGVVAGLFIFTMLIFLAYDYFGEKRRDNLVNVALEKNAFVSAANQQLANQARRQLEHFACMSHEIRTPLNCIVGLSSLLLDSPDEDLPSSVADTVRMINTSADLLNGVVDDVLDYAKMESGNVVVTERMINLQDTLRSILIGLGPKFEEKGLKIITNFGPTLPRQMETDPRRLQQILYNLLSNACKFSKTGSRIDFSVTLKEKSSAERVVEFIVKDYGKGIQRGSFESIFQPFSKASKETQTVYGGTGLGLSITRNLVERLGGRISVDSALGKFTEFVVELPFHGSLVETVGMKSRLKNTTIVFFTSDTLKDSHPFSDDVVEAYGVDLIKASSWTDVDQIALDSQRKLVLVLPSVDLDQFKLEKFSQSVGGAYTLITYGEHTTRPSVGADMHWGEIESVFPSVALHSILKCGNRQMLSTSEKALSTRRLVGLDGSLSGSAPKTATASVTAETKPLFAIATPSQSEPAPKPLFSPAPTRTETKPLFAIGNPSQPESAPTPLFSAASTLGPAGTKPLFVISNPSRPESAPIPLFSTASTQGPPGTKPLFAIGNPSRPESVSKPLFAKAPPTSNISLYKRTIDVDDLQSQRDSKIIDVDELYPPTEARMAEDTPPAKVPARRRVSKTIKLVDDLHPPPDSEDSFLARVRARKAKTVRGVDDVHPPTDLKTEAPPVQQAEKTKRPVQRTASGALIAPLAAFASAAKPKVYPTRQMKVLYAEDNKINQKVLSRILTRLGAKDHDIVDDGKQAFDISAEKHYDLIFMDIQMPVMDGLEATRLIKERDGDLAKIVFCTAHAVDDFRVQAQSTGCDGFVSKPFNIKTIADVLDEYEPNKTSSSEYPPSIP